MVAVTSTLRARGHWHAKVGLKVMIGSSSVGRGACVPSPMDRRPRHCRTASRVPTASISTANEPSSAVPGTAVEARAPAIAPPVATTPKATPRPSRTLPVRYAATAPTSEVTPTTTSDPVVAWAGLCPRA